MIVAGMEEAWGMVWASTRPGSENLGHRAD